MINTLENSSMGKRRSDQKSSCFIWSFSLEKNGREMKLGNPQILFIKKKLALVIEGLPRISGYFLSEEKMYLC